MRATNKQKSAQLSVKVEGGQLRISMGIALLAFAVQSQDQWPEDAFVNDIDDFARSMTRQLRREQEDGTTPVHRMLDEAAQEVVEQGEEGVDEGNVEAGIDLAKAILDNKAAQPSDPTVEADALADLRQFIDLIEGRAMAADGPVTTFVSELAAASDIEKARFTDILKELYRKGQDEQAD